MMDEERAATTLEEIDRLRRRARRQSHPFWFPLVLFGVLGVVATPFCGIGAGHGHGAFWMVAGPVGGAITAFYYRRREMTLGAGVNGLPYVLVAMSIMAGASLLGGLGPGWWRRRGPWWS